jgi:hypothetical protein
MFTCPHCAERGVGFFDKLLSTPLFPASCKRCRGRSTKRGTIIWAQLLVAAAYLATAPYVLPSAQVTTGNVLAVLIILAVGQLAPMRRCG